MLKFDYIFHQVISKTGKQGYFLVLIIKNLIEVPQIF